MLAGRRALTSLLPRLSISSAPIRFRAMDQKLAAEQRLKEANKLLNTLKLELEDLKKLKAAERVGILDKENEILRQQVKNTIQELIRLETANGKKQVPLPNQDLSSIEINNKTDSVKQEIVQKTETVPAPKAAKEPKPKKVKTANEKPAAVDDEPIDVGRLDFRVGRIIDVGKHPDADSLYVEKVDCGEAAPRTVVSGLVKHILIEEMQNRLVVLLCNLKPAKMRGVTSEAMVMCASTPDKVEILSPPSGSQPGDLVECEGYARKPDTQLNPKKKIFETCSPDLLTNSNKEACYKNVPLIVPGKGTITSQTLSGVNVR